MDRTPRIWSSSTRRCTRPTRGCTAFDVEVDEAREGFLVLAVSGPQADHAFRLEAGGHRYQRIPPTERRGRVQTSTVTVAVLPLPSAHESRIHLRDVEIHTCRGSGAGGQHRNKTDSAVQARHIPTGIVVRSEGQRSQPQNRAHALEVLAARVAAREREATVSARELERRRQVGSGQRGDKVRTIRVQDGRVTDHRTGRKTTADRYFAGHLGDLVG